MKFGKIFYVCAVATFISFSALAQGLPQATQPEEVGFSSQRLTRLTAVFQSEVDPGSRRFDRQEGQSGLFRKRSGFKIAKTKSRCELMQFSELRR